VVVSTASAPGLARQSRQDTLDISLLADMDWIVPPSGTPIRQMIDAVFAAAGRTVPVPLLEAYAVRTVASAMQQLPRAITILPRDVAQAVADTGAAEVMPRPLPWNLPPVGLAWLRDSPKAGVIQGLASALR
jgi:DNA-binding transcriptional LysR family regulator